MDLGIRSSMTLGVDAPMASYEKQPLLQRIRPDKSTSYVLVIHGGAGTMSKAGSTPEQRAAYKLALTMALEEGYKILRQGGEAMDGAVAAVASMEDNPLFNAGKGAVFNVAGKNELEASIMLSKPPASQPHIPSSRRGLGLTLLTRTRNPSQLARRLYLLPSQAPHTFLSGTTPEKLGEDSGIELVDPSYFWTERRWIEHRRGLGLPDDIPDEEQEQNVPPMDLLPKGTVGAVALDIRGCIATITSTGGRTNKLVGRIGDTPSMGSGYWAEEWDSPPRRPGLLRKLLRKICKQRQSATAVGISGTGDGDYFIRLSTASTIARRMQCGHETVNSACESAVADLFNEGGIGGVIALDNLGNVAMPLNCPGMYRGVIREDGIAKIAIFSDDPLE